MPKSRDSAGGNQTGQSSEETITNSSIPETVIPPQPPRPPGRRPISLVAGPVSVGVNYGEIKIIGSRIMIDQENLQQGSDCILPDNFCIDPEIDCGDDHDDGHDCDDDVDHYHEHHHHDFDPDLGTF